MTLSGRHFPGAGVPRHFHRLACAFAVRAVRPWAWQLAMFVTVLGADFHRHYRLSAVCARRNVCGLLNFLTMPTPRWMLLSDSFPVASALAIRT